MVFSYFFFTLYRLKGFFSRIDYPQTAFAHGDTNVVKSLSITLPKGASDVYYKDTIGNVSWSNFRNERDRSLLEMRPRYPLYGGWRYSWFHGYNAPLTNFLKFSSNEYVLAVPFLGGIPNITYDSVSVRVVLPEGSS